MALLAVAMLLPCGTVAGAEEQLDGFEVEQRFDRVVDRRLAVPVAEQQAYAQMLARAFADAGIVLSAPQYVVAVDRHPRVQALFLYRFQPPQAWHWVGASPVSTGQPGRVDYFYTPVGVFAHTTANPDFRAEGTRNRLGILGYGRTGLRVFDFGWQQGERGWGGGGRSQMRLQMHATDPDMLEPLLGTARSKGCIRIAASLNRYIDHHGLLDADYEQDRAAGKHFWVLPPDRQPTAWSGRYLVVVESSRASRPAWSPEPRVARARKMAASDGDGYC